jgi:hypothetical protein
MTENSTDTITEADILDTDVEYWSGWVNCGYCNHPMQRMEGGQHDHDVHWGCLQQEKDVWEER